MPDLSTRAKHQEWMESGLCAQVDPEIFFPEKGGWKASLDAKKVCSGCDFIEVCREYALANQEEFGVWGGTSERDRHKILVQRERDKAQAQAAEAA